MLGVQDGVLPVPPNPIMSKTSQSPTVAVIAEEAGYAKRMLLGVAAFLREHEGWLLQLVAPTDAAVEDALKRIEPTGLLIFDCFLNARMSERIASLQLPVVSSGCEGVDFRHQLLRIDAGAIGGIASKTFLDRGFRNIGFVGALAQGETRLRYEAFRSRLEMAGVSPLLFIANTTPGQTAEGSELESAPTRARLARWLDQLPKPAAVFASDDRMAFEVHLCCTRLGIRIPDQVALLGVNDDAFLCRIANPNLSSIRLPFERMGYDAAKCLRKMMRGAVDVKVPLVYEPVGLIVRDSTKQVVVEDVMVRDALIYIQENCMRPVNVEDILDALKVSRSLLERRFKEAIGVTPLVELRRQRIELARALLSDTTEPIQDLGARCGFSSPIRFTTVFREQVGMTPSEFRKLMIPGANG
jgi:LacI family transcriptional regulator